MAVPSKALVGGILQVALATLALHLILIQPNHPGAMTWAALKFFPLELPVIVLGLMLLGQNRWAIWIRSALVALLIVLAVFKIADYGMFVALSRDFNPAADLPLVSSAVNLSIDTMGIFLSVGALLAVSIGLILTAVTLWWATGVFSKINIGSAFNPAMAITAFVFIGLAIAEIGHAMGGWTLSWKPPGGAFTARTGIERVVMVRETLANLRAFKRAAEQDPYADRQGLLTQIDRDVLLIFVESYGRTSFDTKLYAATHLDTLHEAETRLASLGLTTRSGFLKAPTRGGQSWLSHATLSNGLWISDQTSYGAALTSGRKTLFHLASAAGFRTAAVMPQITLDWPEAGSMGFETILAARDLGYEGKPFNWVTMPDQFTLSALDRLLRSGSEEQHLFAQIALGSSHAPWVPVPELIDWDAVGNGRIFNAMAASGDPPKVVWRDRDRVRDQYRQAIDYALKVVFEYVAREAANPPLVVVVGDHQAAPFVALDERDHVPIHVIGPRKLVERTKVWGLTKGLIPDPDSKVQPMDHMRNLILDAFSYDRIPEKTNISW